MKKIVNYTLSLIAGALILSSCAKEVLLTDSAENGSAADKKEKVISASLEGLKVAVAPTLPASGAPVPTGATLTWESTDQLRVYNHADRSQYSDFRLISGEGTNNATFSGAEIAGATSFDVEILNGSVDFGEQTQPADGDAGDLKYFASASNVTDLSAISLGNFSSVLALTAKMPSQAIAAGVKSLEIEASEAIFNAGNTLKVTFETAGSTDEYLNFYASLPAGSTAVPAGTTLLVKFNAPGTDHTVYTRYLDLPASTFTSNKVNTINVDATRSASNANASTVAIGTAANPYLIGDKYQLDSVRTVLVDNATIYFKMIDDVDMSGVEWTYLNTDSGYLKSVNFDGNHKTISNLHGAMFYVFKGSIKDLTLDGSTGNANAQRGALADYIQKTGHVITNVDVKNSTITAATNAGGLIGRINNGTTGTTTVTITDCDIIDSRVSGKSAGGLIGAVEIKIEVSDCTVSGTPVTKSGTGTQEAGGGLIGVISNDAVTVSDCSVSDSNVSGNGIVGGLIGYINSASTVSGCLYTGGTVTTTARYAGGAIGSIGEFAAVVSDCHVENATVDASSMVGESRIGGFIGQIQVGGVVKGCTVGTSSLSVNVKTGAYDESSNKSINSGGFVGVNYGTVTKDADGNHCTAYVNVTSTNTVGAAIQLGGFVGFQRGTIEYSDVVVDMSSVQGQRVGGFAGYITYTDGQTTLTDHCTVSGSIRGNNYTGGFVGHSAGGAHVTSHCHVLPGTTVIGQSTAGGFAGLLATGTVTDCSAAATMNCRGGNDGGFAGAITAATVTRCSSAGSLNLIEGTNNIFGGFVGYLEGSDLTKCFSTTEVNIPSRNYIGGLIGSVKTANTVSQCYYSGTISGVGNYRGGLIGIIETVAAVVTDCYTAGELIGSSGTQGYGGIVGELKTGASVVNCYSTMDLSHGGRATGGIIGRACNGGWDVSTSTGNTVSKCIAWNPHITFDGTPATSASSGGIIGYTSFKNILNNCYRRADMVYLNSNTAVGTSCQTSMVDQIDCDGTNWGISGTRPSGTAPDGTSSSAQYQAPYYGVAAGAGATVSSLAQSLGWSSEIWDFSEDTPSLR